jgi:hypothetical protein
MYNGKIKVEKFVSNRLPLWRTNCWIPKSSISGRKIQSFSNAPAAGRGYVTEDYKMNYVNLPRPVIIAKSGGWTKRSSEKIQRAEAPCRKREGMCRENRKLQHTDRH